MNKEISLTGASGFVGTHLSKYLSANSFQVREMNLRFSELKLGNAYALIHLAGKAHDHKGTAESETYFKVNTALTEKVFQLFLKSETRVFVYFSSVAAITDENVTGILTEAAAPYPQHPYGKSKLAAETYLLNQVLPDGKKLYIIRPAMIHGPGDKGNLTLLYKIVAKGIPYPLAAFHNRRSFLGIDNLCFAIEQMITRAEQIPSGVYNLVDDTPVSTQEVVNLIASVLGKKEKNLAIKPAVVKAIARLGDFLPLPLNSKRLAKLSQDFVVSNDKIKKALGINTFPFTAQQGLKKTIESFRSE